MSIRADTSEVNVDIGQYLRRRFLFQATAAEPLSDVYSPYPVVKRTTGELPRMDTTLPRPQHPVASGS